jgi:endonuclease III
MPTDATVRLGEIDRLLAATFAPSQLGNQSDPLDELIYIILSAQCEEYNYSRTFAALRRRFPRWEDARLAGEAAIFEEISLGGLGRKKAGQIAGLLGALSERYGAARLPDLESMSDDDVESLLVSLPGVGSKTARCVLLYCLDRPSFPVDTHVWRILARLGLTSPSRAKPDRRDQAALQEMIPPSTRGRMHVNLVLLGRSVCTARNPRCIECPLATICATHQAAWADNQISPIPRGYAP